MPRQPNWNWTFKGYVDQRADRLQVWYDAQDGNVRAEFDWLLKRLRNRSKEDWSTLGSCKKLRGSENRGLFELRFEAQRVPYRPIGMFGIGEQTFTLLTVARKHDFDTECATARTRRSLVTQSPGTYSHESPCLSDFTKPATRR